MITLCLQLDGSDEIEDVGLNHKFIENTDIAEASLSLVDASFRRKDVANFENFESICHSLGTFPRNSGVLLAYDIDCCANDYFKCEGNFNFRLNSFSQTTSPRGGVGGGHQKLILGGRVGVQKCPKLGDIISEQPLKNIPKVYCCQARFLISI